MGVIIICDFCYSRGGCFGFLVNHNSVYNFVFIFDDRKYCT